MEARLRMKKEMGSGGVKKKMGVQKETPKHLPPAPEISKKTTEKAEPPKPSPKAEAKPEKPKAPPRIDFIQRNIDQAAEQKSRAKKNVATKKEKLIEQRHAPGEIPHYIEATKEKMRMAKEPAKESDCPPGMRLLSEEEKQEAIESLQEQKRDIESQLSKFSLRLESPTILREKRMLEAELDQIEQSIQQLGKKYVFVPDDDDDY